MGWNPPLSEYEQIGLHNVQYRLKLMLGESYRFEMTSTF
jgi:sensor histidine kinase YesM